MVFAGDHVFFNTKEVGDAELSHHNEQPAIVQKQKVETDPEVGGMYRLRFFDGFECDAFEDEIIPLGAQGC